MRTRAVREYMKSIEDPLFDECLEGLIEDLYAREHKIRMNILSERTFFEKAKSYFRDKIYTYKEANNPMTKAYHKSAKESIAEIEVDCREVLKVPTINVTARHPDPKVREYTAKLDMASPGLLQKLIKFPENVDIITHLDWIVNNNTTKKMREHHIAKEAYIDPEGVQWFIKLEKIFEKSKDYVKMESEYKLSFEAIEKLMKSTNMTEEQAKTMHPRLIALKKENAKELEELMIRKIHLYREKMFDRGWLEKIRNGNSKVGALVAIGNAHLDGHLSKRTVGFTLAPENRPDHASASGHIAEDLAQFSRRIQNAINEAGSDKEEASEELDQLSRMIIR